MGFLDRFRRGSAAPAEAAKPKPGENFNPDEFFSKGVKVDPRAQREGTKTMPKAVKEVPRRRQETKEDISREQKSSPIGEAKKHALDTYKYQIASKQPDTLARMSDFQKRIDAVRGSLIDFARKTAGAEQVTAQDKADFRDMKSLMERVVSDMQTLDEQGLIKLGTKELRGEFTNAEKRISQG